MVELFANSGDPDQMPHSAASDLGLHCLPITLLGVSRLTEDGLKKDDMYVTAKTFILTYFDVYKILQF